MYENLSLLYDDYMADVDYDSWASYLLSLLRKSGINPQLTLELGCGSGNLTLPLSNHLSIIGVDLSDEMLTLAEIKTREQGKDILYLKGDMRKFQFLHKVDLIICACDTVNCLAKDEIEPFFKTVKNQLTTGGVFLFDIVSEHYLKDFIAQRPFIFETDDLTFIWESELKKETIDFYFTYFIKDGDLYRKEQDGLTETLLSQEFVKTRLKQAGFKEIISYKFITEEEASESDDRIQFFART